MSRLPGQSSPRQHSFSPGLDGGTRLGADTHPCVGSSLLPSHSSLCPACHVRNGVSGEGRARCGEPLGCGESRGDAVCLMPSRAGQGGLQPWSRASRGSCQCSAAWLPHVSGISTCPGDQAAAGGLAPSMPKSAVRWQFSPRPGATSFSPPLCTAWRRCGIWVCHLVSSPSSPQAWSQAGLVPQAGRG